MRRFGRRSETGAKLKRAKIEQLPRMSFRVQSEREVAINEDEKGSKKMKLKNRSEPDQESERLGQGESERMTNCSEPICPKFAASRRQTRDVGRFKRKRSRTSATRTDGESNAGDCEERQKSDDQESRCPGRNKPRVLSELNTNGRRPRGRREADSERRSRPEQAKRLGVFSCLVIKCKSSFREKNL